MICILFLDLKRFAIRKNIAGSRLSVIGDERKKESELSEPGTEAGKNTKNFTWSLFYKNFEDTQYVHWTPTQVCVLPTLERNKMGLLICAIVVICSAIFLLVNSNSHYSKCDI